MKWLAGVCVALLCSCMADDPDRGRRDAPLLEPAGETDRPAPTPVAELGELRVEVDYLARGGALIVAVECGTARHCTRRLLAEDRGRPDRLAISPDGAAVAYVSGATGIASVYVVAVSGGSPVQLTNAGLERRRGRPPAGFVPPPHRSALHFDGDFLWWRSADGAHQVRWR